MKIVFLLFLFPVFMIDVFGGVVEVSVTVGDSVTLHNDIKIQREDVVEWSFGQEPIAMIDDGSTTILASHEKLKERLQLDKQTGDLKIRDITSTDSGDYKLEITRTEGSLTKTFSVRVVPGGELKPALVLVGDLVTLYTDVTDVQKYGVKRWKFGPQRSFIAEVSTESGNITKFDPAAANGIFRDKLELDCETGSLTIKDIETSHSGLYEADIISSSGKHTIHKTFSVSVSGEMKTLSVKEGDPLTLQTGFTEIPSYDFIQWKFGTTTLAEIYIPMQKFNTQDGNERLKLDNQSGSLTITNIRTTDTGLYELKISSSRHTIHKKIIVSVTGSVSGTGLHPATVTGIVLLFLAVVAAGMFYAWRRKNSKLKKQMHKAIVKSVTKGKNVTLHSDLNELTDTVIMWIFGDKGDLIARFPGRNMESPMCNIDVRFAGRLRLNTQTGSLTITKVDTTDSGLYKLKILSGKSVLFAKNPSKSFIVNVSDSTANEGNGAEDAVNPLIQEP